MSTVIGLDFDVKGLDKLQSAANLLDEVYQSNKPMIENSNTPSMVQSSIDNTDNKEQLLTMESFSNAIQNVTSSVRGLIDSFEKLQKETENNIRTEESKKSILPPVESYSSVKKETSEKSFPANNEQGMINSAQNIANLATAIANQNPSAGIISGINTAGGSLIKKSKELSSMEDYEGFSDVLKKLGVATVLAGTALKVADVTTQKYENALPGIDSLLQTYGGNNANQRSSEVNSAVGLNLRNKILEYNKGTGLTNEDFIGYSTQLSKYGINDVNRGGSITQDAAFWSRYTGMRMESALGFMGTVERLGGDGKKTMDEVYGNAIASGIDKNQFPEFLDGVQRAIETGVSQGFIRSAKDVSESLSLLSRLSGGDPTWQGEYGVQRYNQMVSGMANNTSLNSTSSMIMYRAANNMVEAKGAKELLGQNKYLQDNGANWINTMAYIEKGDLSASFLSNLKNAVDGAYGGDTASKVLTYKEQFGLNYQGAIEIYNALEKLGKEGANEESIKSEIEKITQNKEFKSDNSKLQDSLNSIDKAVVNLGKGTFDIKSDVLNKIGTNVENIYGSMIFKGGASSAEKMANVLFTDTGLLGSREENTAKSYFTKMGGIADSKGYNSEEGMAFLQIEGWYNSLSEWEKNYIDRTNLINNSIDTNPVITWKNIQKNYKKPEQDSPLGVNDDLTQSTVNMSAGEFIYRTPELYNQVRDYADKKAISVETAIDQLTSEKYKLHFVDKYETLRDTATEPDDYRQGIFSHDIEALTNVLKELIKELTSGINVN